MRERRSGRVLAFRHEASSHAGRLGPILKAGGLEVEEIDLARDAGQPVEVESAAGLVFLGGTMSANDGHQFLRREYELIEAGLRLGIPMLGMCLGAQMIARVLGAPVRRHPAGEIGWHPVWWTEAAEADALLAGLGQPEWIFHWHNETFDLPADAAWLGRSEACANQAFRYGANIHGFQFHLEATPSMIAQWLDEDARCGVAREAVSAIDPGAHEAEMDRLAGTVFGRWAKLVGCSRP